MYYVAGYDCWWSMHRLFPRVIGGSRRHEIHHKYGSYGNYQQFFMYLDDFMGTSAEATELREKVITMTE
jgi:sterol desaturase/sphingolipid hydroxylase (fatty acid hydroxylase superfamily)